MLTNGVIFDQGSAQRIANATRRVERTSPTSSADASTTSTPSARNWIELTGVGTGADAGKYSWKLVYPSPASTGGWKDASPAITGTTNAIEANGAQGLYVSGTHRRYEATFVGYDSAGKATYLFNATQQGLFPVSLTAESGGSSGSKTTGCTYTYTAKDAATASVTLGTGLTPTMKRRTAVGKFSTASTGIACFVGSTFTLWDADELPATGGCTS